MTENGINEKNRRMSDGYYFSTRDESELLTEVMRMELHSRWIKDVKTSDLALSAIPGPIYATEAVSKYGLPTEETFETAAEGSMLILHDNNELGASHYLIRGIAIPSVCREAKLEGSSLGKMDRITFADVINKAFNVTTGKTLLLVRFGKIAALLSEQYQIMPISDLLRISKEELRGRFGELRFKYGTNEHAFTSAVWELPDAQNDLLSKYQETLRKYAVSRCVPANFMPAVKFCSSDTGGSSACLIPFFKLNSGTYFRLGKGVEVNHKKSSHGISRFQKEAETIYAKFEDSLKTVEKLAKIEVWNPTNTVISICNKYGISKKYGAKALELVERYAIGSPCLSAHDVYLCICEVVGYAQKSGARNSFLLNLEENVAKIVNCDWSEHDVPGTVAWKTTASKGA